MIKRVQSSREIDFCLGSFFGNGMITSRFCCETEEFFIQDLESSNQIDFDLHSVFIADQICFINITNDFNQELEAIDVISNCSILIFDHYLDDFVEKNIDVENITCSSRTCYMNFYCQKNQTILNGTSIICENSRIYGIVINRE